MVACGALTLAVSGGISAALSALFAAALVLAWKLEETRWQLSERTSLWVVLLALPLFYFDWKYQTGAGVTRDKVAVSALAHIILFLSAIKLLQVKADRDWTFLYLISFFKVLLAAGLSISPSFLAALVLYMLAALCAIISFEIRKARRGLKITETRLLVATDSSFFRRLSKGRARPKHLELRRLPVVALALLLLIFAIAMPLFFIAPRFGSSALARTGGGLKGFVGFSDTVTLGDIGRLQQSDKVVMRVRVEDAAATRNRNLRWRGVALDEFNGRAWHRSKSGAQVQASNERSLFQLGTTEGLHRLTTQTFFIEPVDTPYLFAASRVVALQGALPFIARDAEGSIQTRRHEQERISYKAFSDTTTLDENSLRADSQPYAQAFARYLQLPAKLDPRIAKLAREVTTRAGARNRYDAARAIESHLQQDYGYTLEMKAGGIDPLADFLFRVREGHCEYFSTAMAIMLRTEGIAARVVNGFQMGEYNSASDAYTVTQRDAHSWVEVYFPETDSWVTFDPTPAAGRAVREHVGWSAQFGKYAEALDLLWLQYVVGYDKQEQHSLAATINARVAAYRLALGRTVASLKATLAAWFAPGRNNNNPAGVFLNATRGALLVAAAVLVLMLAALFSRWAKRLGLRRAFNLWQKERADPRVSIIGFYERMTKALAARGLRRAENETPLEFATAAGMPEVLKITRAYNRVRYGEHNLSASELTEINEWLKDMEEAG